MDKRYEDTEELRNLLRRLDRAWDGIDAVGGQALTTLTDTARTDQRVRAHALRRIGDGLGAAAQIIMGLSGYKSVMAQMMFALSAEGGLNISELAAHASVGGFEIGTEEVSSRLHDEAEIHLDYIAEQLGAMTFEQIMRLRLRVSPGARLMINSQQPHTAPSELATLTESLKRMTVELHKRWDEPERAADVLRAAAIAHVQASVILDLERQIKAVRAGRQPE